MPIAGTRKINSPWTPKIDLGGRVYYAPLWRPDMVARGGSIASGTGTMDVTPLNLAVGANTITATGAGTFIITVPQAGTCASGTATITGSPVTLNAGVATTVTTGVTTGTFTVTTGNIISSRDSTGYLMTIVGATWGNQGRTFDGVDDEFSSTSPFGDIDLKGQAFTLLQWIKLDAATPAWGSILGIKPTTATNFGVQAYYSTAASPNDNRIGIVFVRADGNSTGRVALKTPETWATATWYHLSLKYDGTGTPGAGNVLCHINGVVSTLETVATSFTWGANNTLKIGYLGSDACMKGIIREATVYNRQLNLSETENHRQKTMWRSN